MSFVVFDDSLVMLGSFTQADWHNNYMVLINQTSICHNEDLLWDVHEQKLQCVLME